MTVVYEKQVDIDGGVVEIPTVRSLGVEREKGFIGVVALGNLEIRAAEVKGAHKIDVKDLPPTLPLPLSLIAVPAAAADSDAAD